MVATPVTGPIGAAGVLPVRSITIADLDAALREGCEDFRAKRGDLIFIGILYPLIGLITAAAVGGSDVLPLLFPILAGLSLLGPLAAIGFYELARRREAGLDSSWWHFLEVRSNPSIEQIGLVAALLIIIFAAWLGAAAAIYALFFGGEPPLSLGGFARDVLTTPKGWGMIIAGNLVGLGFAMLVLMVSVVSLPLLVDRQVDAGTAIRTSLAAFGRNRAVLLRWGLTVAALLVLGSIPFFFGLAIVLPVLGYATWHLYTRLVDRNAA